MISSPYHMEMTFVDPESGAAHGFPFRGADLDLWRGDRREEEVEDLVVDFIVTPLLKTYGPPEDQDLQPPSFWPKYYASVSGGYNTCYSTNKMRVFVDGIPGYQYASKPKRPRYVN